MDITIIVPAYNIEQYLPRCLDSILAQTYENLEIIVVNDGSRDNTAGVIDSYAARDSRIKAIHKENGGVTSARLRGIAEANGVYIGFVDGDDYIEPEMFEKLLANAESYNAEISHCGYRMVFPSRVDYYHNSGQLIIQEGTRCCTDLLEGRVTEPALWNKLYRRELFAGLSEWMDMSIRLYEDLLMNFFLFRQAKRAVFEDICPYHYVLREGSAVTSALNEHQLTDLTKVLHLLLSETANAPQWNAIVERRLIYQLVSTATLATNDQRELILPVRRDARKELRNRLWSVLTGNSCNIKLKIMALWAAIWPWSYCIVHKVYARLRGTDKKYEVR